MRHRLYHWQQYEYNYTPRIGNYTTPHDDAMWHKVEFNVEPPNAYIQVRAKHCNRRSCRHRYYYRPPTLTSAMRCYCRGQLFHGTGYLAIFYPSGALRAERSWEIQLREDNSTRPIQTEIYIVSLCITSTPKPMLICGNTNQQPPHFSCEWILNFLRTILFLDVTLIFNPSIAAGGDGFITFQRIFACICNKPNWNSNSAFRFLILSCYLLHHPHIHIYFRKQSSETTIYL